MKFEGIHHITAITSDAQDNIDFYAGLYSVPDTELAKRKDYVLTMAGIKEKRADLTSLLAGGWKQRLALGCAILHSPPVLFLDEPTAGLDPVSAERFDRLIEGHGHLVMAHVGEELHAHHEA